MTTPYRTSETAPPSPLSRFRPAVDLQTQLARNRNEWFTYGQRAVHSNSASIDSLIEELQKQMTETGIGVVENVYHTFTRDGNRDSCLRKRTIIEGMLSAFRKELEPKGYLVQLKDSPHDVSVGFYITFAPADEP